MMELFLNDVGEKDDTDLNFNRNCKEVESPTSPKSSNAFERQNSRRKT
jgi:hypothetical protein